MIYVYRGGKVVPRHEASPHPREGRRPTNLMRDLEPFVSVVDGSIISSRSDRREHNRRNRCIDIGDDPAILRPKKPYEPTGIGEDIKRAMDFHDFR